MPTIGRWVRLRQGSRFCELHPPANLVSFAKDTNANAGPGPRKHVAMSTEEWHASPMVQTAHPALTMIFAAHIRTCASLPRWKLELLIMSGPSVDSAPLYAK
jgi:hypothetical protein